MAYPQDDIPGQRYDLSYENSTSSGAGRWLLAAAVFIVLLIIGLAMLSGPVENTSATDAATPAVTDEAVETAPAATEGN